jgi:ABC-type amino acid transport substrate-binding protein
LIDQGIALKLQAYSDTRDSLEDLVNGYVDVALNDKVNTIEYIKKHPELKIVGDVLEPAQFGIAVQKGDSGMLEIVNAALKDLRDQKKLDALYTKWVQGQ